MDSKVVDTRRTCADREPLELVELEHERAVLLLLARETYFVPGLRNQGTYVRRELVQDRTGLGVAVVLPAVRYLVGRGLAYRKAGGWIRITHEGSLVAFDLVARRRVQPDGAR